MEEILRYLYVGWRILVSRRWFALTTAWAICVVGWLGVASLPDQYESEAQIYVDTTTLLGPLLKGIAVQGNINQQLVVMQRTLLSRPNIEKVIRENDLDLKVVDDNGWDALVNSVESRANIRVVGPNLFVVGFVDQNPNLAKRITQSLLDIFVSANVGENRKGMESAQSFIETQIAKYEKQLQAAEARKAAFQSKHADILTGGTFSNRFEASRRAYRNAERELEDTRLVKAQLETLLAKTPRFLEIDQNPSIIVQGGQQVSSTEQEVRSLEQQLASLRSQYTDNHPDVKSMERSLADARKRLEAEKAAKGNGGSGSRKGRIPNTVYEQLQVRLFGVQQDLVRLQKNYTRTKQEFELLEKRKEAAPGIEAQLAGLNRDYSVIKAQYEALLKRRESVNISAAREASTDSVQFRIIEPPEVPSRPSGPKRVLFSVAVLFVGIGAGVALPILFALMSGYIYDRKDLEETFNLPVLGTVQYMAGTADVAGRLFSFLLFALGGGALALTLLGVVYLQPNPSMIDAVFDRYDVNSYVEQVKGAVSNVF
ncbi:XrtA system polysaccharide chain length determinant [Aestuariispira ectoiniformans]|uniref:XrtA system polysaccharide chain length determinant n=1 Tax=Aestuariispira ectoiniformans TaxID=2775080 RepID=UPI00223A8291|nr:XrtA system polysaccharide chain length determinant [Aestuariispira ectoiniformans]